MAHVRLRLVLVAAIAAIRLSSGPATAQTPAPDQAEVQALKAELEKTRLELEAVRRQYDQRLAALEQRLVQLTGAAAPIESIPVAAPPVPPPEPAPPDPMATGGGSGVFAKIFNPDISVVGNMLGAAGPQPRRGQPCPRAQ